MADIGIDLGTTNSAVARLRGAPDVIENQGRQTTPSVVAWDDDGQGGGEIIVGQAAKDQSMVLECVISVKRHMGSDKKFKLGAKEYTAPQVSAMVLGELKKAAEKRLDEPIDHAVITIPAYFNEAQKHATKEAAKLAGLGDVRLLPEPVAAALAYGAEDTILVYDLGGGTFDVAIIDCFDYTMLSLEGDNWLGGDDFDNRLMAHLAREVQAKFKVDIESTPQSRQLAKNACEKAKIELSERQHTRIFFQCMIGSTPVNLTLPVTREQFEGMIMNLVDRTLEKVQAAIDKAGEREEGFTKDSINTVLLVGGSTYVPLVQKRITDYFGREPSKKVSPDLAVALGAAVHTATGAMSKDGHRLRVDPVAMVTANESITLAGRTSPGAAVEVTGGAGQCVVTADANGKFEVTCQLRPGAINELKLTATDATGDTRSSDCQVRHDANHTGKEEKGRRQVRRLAPGVTARALGIKAGIGGMNDRLGVIIAGQTDIPCVVHNREYAIVSNAANMPGVAEMLVFEGELPFAPLNTLLGTVRIDTPASPSTAEPIEITFQINDDHLLVVTARMVNYPDRVVTASIKRESPSGSQQHVIERSERVLNVCHDKLRPEVKARLNKNKQALIDLCEQFRTDPQAERYQRICDLGSQLRQELDRIEAEHN